MVTRLDISEPPKSVVNKKPVATVELHMTTSAIPFTELEADCVSVQPLASGILTVPGGIYFKVTTKDGSAAIRLNRATAIKVAKAMLAMAEAGEE